MPLSLSQAQTLTCPQCNTPFNSDIWLIVDAGERPDLAARCRDGSIHIVACPNGHGGMMGAPLLYHDRSKKQLFLAYPPNMTEEQVQQVGGQLVGRLRGQMLILPGSEYLEMPQALPLEFLGAAIDDKLDQVVAELEKQSAQAQALSQDPAVAAALQVLSQHDALGQTILQWMNFEAWDASREFFWEHPEIAGEEADEVFAALRDIALAREDAEMLEDLDVHVEIVRAARASGIDVAYQRYLVTDDDGEPQGDPRAELQARFQELGIHSQADLERLLPDHPELEHLIQRVMQTEDPLLQAINQLMTARSPQDVAFLVRNHPVLLTDEGMNALREIMSNALAQGDTEMVKQLQARIETLEQLKAGS